MSEELLNAKNVSGLLGIPVERVWKLCRDNELTYIKVGRSKRFTVADVQNFISSNRVSAK